MSYRTKNIYPIYFSKQEQKTNFFVPVKNIPNKNQQGQVSYSYNENTNTLEYTISNVMTSSPILYGHIHKRDGMKNPVIKSIDDIQITGSGSTTLPNIKGNWIVPLEYREDLKNKRLYINIHTNDYQNGEIESVFDLTK